MLRSARASAKIKIRGTAKSPNLENNVNSTVNCGKFVLSWTSHESDPPVNGNDDSASRPEHSVEAGVNLTTLQPCTGWRMASHRCQDCQSLSLCVSVASQQKQQVFLLVNQSFAETFCTEILAVQTLALWRVQCWWWLKICLENYIYVVNCHSAPVSEFIILISTFVATRNKEPIKYFLFLFSFCGNNFDKAV